MKKKSQEYERVLPLNPDLEKAALHAMLSGKLEPKAVHYNEISKQAQPVYRALVKVYTGQPVSVKQVLAVATELYHGDSDTKSFLKEVQESSLPEIQSVLHTLRRKKVINSLVNEAASQVASGEYSLLTLKSLLDTHEFGSGKLTPLSESVASHSTPPVGVPVPCIPKFTRRFNGLYGIVLISGEPAAGKSTLALQIALSIGRRRPVLYYDFELGPEVIQWRINEALEHDAGKIQDATHQFYLRHAIGMLESDLESIQQPCLIVVDSIQKVGTSVAYRREGLDAWIHKLEALKMYGHHVIMVSEKKRGTYGEAALDGGKESGELEYAADAALDLLLPNEQDASRVEIHVTKNRHYKKKGLLGIYERKNSWWFTEVGTSSQGVD